MESRRKSEFQLMPSISSMRVPYLRQKQKAKRRATQFPLWPGNLSCTGSGHLGGSGDGATEHHFSPSPPRRRQSESTHGLRGKGLVQEGAGKTAWPSSFM